MAPAPSRAEADAWGKSGSPRQPDAARRFASLRIRRFRRDARGRAVRSGTFEGARCRTKTAGSNDRRSGFPVTTRSIQSIRSRTRRVRALASATRTGSSSITLAVRLALRDCCGATRIHVER
jgi:hypothetical protein